MVQLLLSESNSDRLRSLISRSDPSTDANFDALQDAIHQQPTPPDAQNKMNSSSPAVPVAQAIPGGTKLQRLVLDHTLLVSISLLHDQHADSDDYASLKLSELVSGSEVYVPPKPIFKRSKQLEESLAAIRRAQEDAEYAQMSAPSSAFSSTSATARPFSLDSLASRRASGIPSAYKSVAGTDPSLPLSQRIASQYSMVSSKEQKLAEEQEWNDVQRQLSVMLNVFLSIMATATAAWWASGNADAGTKVLISLSVAIVTAVAEIVLYNRYQIYVRQSKAFGNKRMKGSDLKTRSDFQPFQLDSDKKHKVAST